MRLIDADRLYDALADKLLWLMQYGDDTYLSVGDDIRKTIADQPTAYDVEKVAERLEGKVKELENITAKMVLNKSQKAQNHGYYVAIEHAIDIVRAGGKE